MSVCNSSHMKCTQYRRWFSGDTEENSPVFCVPAYWNSKHGFPRTDQLVSTPTFWWKTERLLDWGQMTDNMLITVFYITLRKMYTCQYWVKCYWKCGKNEDMFARAMSILMHFIFLWYNNYLKMIPIQISV